jgi:hypothetical protein
VANWVATEVEKPKIAESSGAVFSMWIASRSATGDAAFVVGCVATPIPGWVEDMRPAVEGRTVALAGASASKITGGPIDARSGNDGVLDLRAANDVTGSVIGHARTFLGFDTSRVFTCFATCASTTPGTSDSSSRECDRSVAEARLEESLPPPPPGLALRSVTWAVHHPRSAALGAFGLMVLAGIVAVAFRRRPRSRIERNRSAS